MEDRARPVSRRAAARAHARPEARPHAAARDAGSFHPYRTPYGVLTIRVDADGVTDVALGDVELSGQRRPTKLAARAATQLQEYLAGKRRSFDLPLAPQGSAFQRKVWEAARQVPYGTSLTCAQLAAQLGDAEGFRAVGAALKKNPLAILVPAHRIVGANGRPLGTGREARLKEALLKMERAACAREGDGTQ